MSQILRDLNKLAKKVGAPVVGTNISEQVRALSTFWEGTSHGANIAERINELAHSEIGKSEPPVEPVLISKSIIQNGDYSASDDEADGYSSVSVLVPDTPQNYTDVACTRAEYEAMQSHSDHVIYTVTNLDTTVNKYLGDDPIGAVVDSKGTVFANKYPDDAAPDPTMCPVFPVNDSDWSVTSGARHSFDRSKAFDIIACMYQSTATYFKDNAPLNALFGGGNSWPYFTAFPSMELQGGGALWCGVSYDGNGWSNGVSKTISAANMEQVMVAGKNWFKLSYDGDSTVSIYHSADGINYTKLGDLPTLTSPMYNSNSDIVYFKFGQVNGGIFKANVNCHICYLDCKIYQEGELIFGTEIKPKNFATA